MSGHCDGYSYYKRFHSTCSGLDRCEVKDISTIEQCKQECENQGENCMAMGFGSHCIIYFDQCNDSEDGVTWGFTFEMKGELLFQSEGKIF